MKPIPFMILSDSPNLHTGLGRITKDIAMIASSIPEFRVGTLGRGGMYSSQLPFAQYCFDEDRGGWGESAIEYAWRDFSAGQRGIVLTIWDLSRLGWLARPRDVGEELGRFLKSQPFDLWGYVPVDHEGIGQRMSGMQADTLQGFKRVLAYTLFGKQILENTLGREVDWMPHGFNERVFQPRERMAGRLKFGISDKTKVIGACMSNQVRKDWGTAMCAISHLKNSVPDLKFWAHTDVLERHWSLPALIQDFGLGNTVMLTSSAAYSSEELSYLYSACDVTMLPSTGEGFGLPLIESMACGVPVIHGNYAGGAEFIPAKEWLVDSVATRLESPWNCVRPVWNPHDWSDKIKWVLDRQAEGEDYRELCLSAVEHLKYGNLAESWRKWLLAGIGK